MLEWLRNLLPTTHKGAVRKDGAEIPIEWRRQRHLTWSTTHDVVSRKINPCKSFDLLRGSNRRPLAPSQATGAHLRNYSLICYIHIRVAQRSERSRN